MSQNSSMRRQLRQETRTSGDNTPEQVGELVFTLDGDVPRASLTFENGCKKVWSNGDPVENPGAYQWDCPDGVDPPFSARGGDRGVDDDDYDYENDDDYGDELIYECTNRKLCNEASPSDESAEGWEFKGVCDFGGGVCPFERYDKTKDYKKGDYVAVEVDKMLHECTNSSKCNNNVPRASSVEDTDGWKMIGGCVAGEECSAVEFDTSKAGRDGYNFGDEVFTKNGRNYGTIVDKGGSGGSGGFGESSEEGIDGSGGSGGLRENNEGGMVGSSGSGSDEYPAGGETGDDLQLIYQCNDKEKCNKSRPSDPLAEGWDVVGPCSPGGDCAPQFTNTSVYNLGDKVSVSVDKLIHECEDKNNCNENVPGASSDKDGWRLIGGCRNGRICNAREFDPSKAANGEYDDGDTVFTRVGYDYGTVGSTGDSATGESNGDIVDSTFCPAPQGVEGSADQVTRKLVTYAYAVETSQVTDANTFLPRLEGQILSNLASSMLSSCLKDERLRRRLEDNGVSGIESFPMDVSVPGGFCNYESPAADGCFAIDGGLTLTLNSGVDPDAAARATRVLLEEAMTSNALLNPDIPEVVKVNYLGESYDDYADGLPAGSPGGQQGGGAPENDKAGTRTQGKEIGLPVALVIVALCALIFTILCYVKRRMANGSKDELNTHGEDSDLEDDLDDVIDRIGGIGNQPQTTFANDPPGSFHMGNHHYTVDGVQYKSLSCAQCQASNSNDAAGILGRMITTQDEVNDLDLNDKNDLSFDLDMAINFIDFSRNDLGRTHSSINVRHCKSATCEICKKTGGVVFVKSHNDVEL